MGLQVERGAVMLKGNRFVAFGPLLYRRHAGGGESPNTRRKLLQRRVLYRAATAYTPRTSCIHTDSSCRIAARSSVTERASVPGSTGWLTRANRNGVQVSGGAAALSAVGERQRGRRPATPANALRMGSWGSVRIASAIRRRYRESVAYRSGRMARIFRVRRSTLSYQTESASSSLPTRSTPPVGHEP